MKHETLAAPPLRPVPRRPPARLAPAAQHPLPPRSSRLRPRSLSPALPPSRIPLLSWACGCCPPSPSLPRQTGVFSAHASAMLAGEGWGPWADAGQGRGSRGRAAARTGEGRASGEREREMIAVTICASLTKRTLARIGVQSSSAGAGAATCLCGQRRSQQHCKRESEELARGRRSRGARTQLSGD